MFWNCVLFICHGFRDVFLTTLTTPNFDIAVALGRFVV